MLAFPPGLSERTFQLQLVVLGKLRTSALGRGNEGP